jgi:ATP-binding cassette subfamily F protein 3
MRGSRVLFEQANLMIHPGARVGVVGANGSGKSSLFALMRGQLQVEAGELYLPENWVIAHVAQETPADPRPAQDYVLDGDTEWATLDQAMKEAEAANRGDELVHLHERMDRIDGYTARSRAARLMHGLGFRAGDEHRPVSDFSGGWRMRLNLAQALMCRSDLLLLDEPTNHLDLEAVLWLEDWLKRYSGTLLLISHDRDFLDAIVGQVLYLDHQRLELYTGNYSEFEHQRAQRQMQQQAAYEKQIEEQQRLQKFIDRFRAKATKARQAQSRIKALERMEEVAPAYADSVFHFEFAPPDKQPHSLLHLKDVAIGYSETPILNGLNLDIQSGDRIALLGPNGAGKSTLVRLLAGEINALSGDLEKHQDLKIGYFAQHHSEALDLQSSALEILLHKDRKLSDQEGRDFLGRFGFAGDEALKPVAQYSGGEKARLNLALIVYARPNLLLLDEPTNHLDLEMRHALTVALQGYEGAVLLVSHDRHLIRTVSERFWLVAEGSIQLFEGGLDQYGQWLAERQNAPTDQHEAVTVMGTESRKERKRREAEHRQQTRPLRDEIKKADQAMEKIRLRLADIEQELSRPEMYEESSRQSLQVLLKEQGELRGRMDELEETWMLASERLEALQEGLSIEG